MAIKEFSEHQVPMLNLNNEEGNVFVLMGIVSNLSRKLDKDSKAIIDEMTSADYKNAVYVFNREFGDFFDIILPQGITLTKSSKQKRGR